MPVAPHSPAYAAQSGLCNDVCQTATPGECTLRAAMQVSNAHPGPDIITFDLPGAGPQTISPASALPAISDAVTIDGYSQPGAAVNTSVNTSNATLMVQLNGTSAAINVTG